MNQELDNSNFNNRIQWIPGKLFPKLKTLDSEDPSETCKRLLYYEKVLYNQWFLREFNYLIMVLDSFIKELYCTDKQFISQMYVELINAKKPLLETQNIEVFLEDYKYFYYMNHLLELCKVVENEFFLSYLKYNFFSNNKNISYREVCFRTKQKLQIKYLDFYFIPFHQIPSVFIFLEKNIYCFVDYRNFTLNRISGQIYEKSGIIQNFEQQLEQNS